MKLNPEPVDGDANNTFNPLRSLPLGWRLGGHSLPMRQDRPTKVICGRVRGHSLPMRQDRDSTRPEQPILSEIPSKRAQKLGRQRPRLREASVLSELLAFRQYSFTEAFVMSSEKKNEKSTRF